MTRTERYDETYALLVQLLEQYEAMTDAALLCVMDAFNVFAELHTPNTLPPTEETSPEAALTEIQHRLDQLIGRSGGLAEALALARARDLVAAALSERR